jgi:Flp pilus assembly protein TadG
MRGRHAQRGASMPEMAVAAVVFFLLLFGIVDFGRALYTYGFVAQLAREGARYYIVRGTTSCANSKNQLPDCNATNNQVQAYVRSLNEGATKTSGFTVTAVPVSCPNGVTATAAPGCTVAVTVTYPFSFAMGFMPSSISMSSTSTMVVSQ